MAIKISSTTSFTGEVKPSAPCRKTLSHFKDPLRYNKDIDSKNSVAISHPLSPPFATRCLPQPEQKTLVDESGMIRAHAGMNNRSDNVRSAWDASYDTTP
jgi:hypothetical protein